MTEKQLKIFHWLPRVIALAWLLFLLIAPVRAFIEAGMGNKYLPGILAGLFPCFIVIIAVALTWKKNLAGAIVFAVFFLLTLLDHLVSGFRSFPLDLLANLLISVCFMMSYFISRKIAHVDEPEPARIKDDVMPLIKKITAITGVVCLAFAMEPFILWFIISAKSLPGNGARDAFLICFPQFLQGKSTLYILGFFLSLAALFLGLLSRSSRQGIWYILCMLCIILGPILAFFNLFWMM